jgi:hypothetical protein
VVKEQFSALSAVSAVKKPIRDAETQDNKPPFQQERPSRPDGIGTTAAGETRRATHAEPSGR